MKRYSKYKDSGVEWIGEIPEKWELFKIKHTCEVSNIQISQTELNGKQVIHYSIPNVQEYREGQIEDGEDIDSSKIIVTGGEVLFSKLNPRKGTACIVKNNDRFMQVCSGEFITMIPKTTIPEFHLFIVSSSSFIQFIDSQVESVTRSHQRVRPDNFLSSLIPIPPISEQQQIVTYLDQKTALIDHIISTSEKKIELLKEKRIATINHAVTKGINPKVKMKDSGVEWIGEIPEHWCLIKLKQKGEVIIGLSYSPDNIVDEQDGTLVMRSSNIQNGKASFNDNVFVNCIIPDKLRLREGDLLICSRNGSRNLIGKNCLISQNENGLTFGVFMSVYRTKVFKIIYWLLNSPVFESQSGLFLTSTINQLTVSTLENMLVPYVENEFEQQQIVTYLDQKTKEIDELISSEQKRIELLKEYRQSLISEVVTGKIKVTKD